MAYIHRLSATVCGENPYVGYKQAIAWCVVSRQELTVWRPTVGDVSVAVGIVMNLAERNVRITRLTIKDLYLVAASKKGYLCSVGRISWLKAFGFTAVDFSFHDRGGSEEIPLAVIR